jgi:hypothetical protein
MRRINLEQFVAFIRSFFAQFAVKGYNIAKILW